MIFACPLLEKTTGRACGMTMVELAVLAAVLSGPCGPADAVAARLGQFGESPAYIKDIADNPPMQWQFWTTPDGRSWTVVIANGELSCIVGDGGRPLLEQPS